MERVTSDPCRLDASGHAVSFVTVDLSYHTASGTWDTHGDNIPPYGGIERGLGPLLPLFDHLVTTLPLRNFIALANGIPEWAHEAADALTSVTVCGFNFGIDRADVADFDWVYVPEPEFPFYRFGFPSAFSKGVCPPGTSS